MLYINQNITISIQKQVILLTIGDGKKYYLAATNISGLLQGNSSNRKGHFYCLNCFNSYTTKKNLKKMKKHLIITIVVE